MFPRKNRLMLWKNYSSTFAPDHLYAVHPVIPKVCCCNFETKAKIACPPFATPNEVNARTVTPEATHKSVPKTKISEVHYSHRHFSTMAVMIASHKNSEPKRTEIPTKRHTKPHYKTRPITATLEHPLILDIKLLKKLDMTTFTKKGLMALSKFCGISLINKTDTKKKLNKCVRTLQYSKKQLETGCTELHLTQIADSNKRELRAKRKLVKKISKAKPRVRFKLAKEDSSPDEDSSDVVCRSHGEVLKTSNGITNSTTDDRLMERKTIIDGILNATVENIIPEPCKTCSRSEHPERFHSHPKMLTKLPSQEKSNEKKLEEQFREALTTKDQGRNKKEEIRKIPCAIDSGYKTPQESPQCDEKKTQNSKSPVKSSSSTEMSSPETPSKNKPKSLRTPFTCSQSSTKLKNESVKKTTKLETNQDEEMSAEEAMKFVTGCYICGKQLSPKSRMKHEKSCITEWRAQNVLVSADKRKPEPKRPDFRFTASGDVDCEGTFQSIWANHMDSLVPCKKCGRKFFPDRIEKHENCCNNLPMRVKYKP